VKKCPTSFLRRIAIVSTTICLTSLFSHGVLAESVVVPIGQQGSQASIERPKTGITKTQVKSRYGEPNGWRPAVGQPPISSWVYDGFTVYFEYDRVIHSVLTR